MSTAVTSIEHIAHITCPDPLRDLPGWLIWRFEPNDNPGGKPRKMPYYANGGRRSGVQGRPEDREALTSFDAARAAAARRGFAGVGFAPLADFGVVALDFDNCVSGGAVDADVLELLNTSYAEYSPSGNGIRAFFRGQLGNLKAHGAPFGFEIFSSKGFVTFTGNVLPSVEILGNINEVAPVDEAVMALVARRFKRELELSDSPSNSDSPPLGLTPAQIDQALEVLPTDLDYDQWVQVGMALHHETQGTGFELWDTWSQRSSKYTSREYALERWNSFGKGAGKVVTARSLVRLANEHGAHLDLNRASPDDFDSIETVDFPVGAAALPKPPRFTPISVAEFASRPPPSWVIKGVIPKAELVVLYGESGSGKSFMALQLAGAISRGVEWRGRRVKQGRVVYIAAEGAGGFRHRCVAYAQAEGIELADLPLDIIADAPNLLLKDDALAVAKGIGKADVVFVDTWAQVTPGGNENAGEDMGRALSHCKGIKRATGAVVVLVHHSGKDASKGARGWSGLRAAADAELEVVRSPAGRLMRIAKQKDGVDDLEWGFALETVQLGVDEDLDPITSCVVVDAQVPSAKVLRTLGPKEQIVNEVIQEMAKGQTQGIEVNAVIAQAVAKMEPPAEGKRDTRKQHARRALESLCAGDDAPYWLHDDGTVEVV
jgi:energy-coupling factor transporter ATP-binding protein EcfA2